MRADQTALPNSVWMVGDSLTRGLSASSEATTYRNRLFGMLQDRYPGAMRSFYWRESCTLARFEELWETMDGSAPDIFFIELGINDATQNTGCPQIPDAEWQSRYGAMLDRISERFPDAAIIVGTTPWSGWESNEPARKRALKINAWIRAAAAVRDIPVADLWAVTVDRDDGISTPEDASPFVPPYHGDYFHPNDLGHERIASTLYAAYADHYLYDGQIRLLYLPVIRI